jgi:predicted hotdog family 3-hydroxylacyl-ACP dehydratase
MPLDRSWLLARIPHQGGMCLLERVDAWDAQHIRCTASSHRAPDNPLRAHGRLGVTCGIEYAAQAMAAHGALQVAVGAPPRAGYLVGARGVELSVARLDDVEADLIVEAERVSGDDHTILYGFRISAGERPLLSGRLIIVLDAAKLARPI